MKFEELYSLVTEIKLNAENSFKWYVMTPVEADQLEFNLSNFKKSFYFHVDGYLYLVVLEHNNELHFWNHTVVMNDFGNDELGSSKLNILNPKDTLKLASTLLGVMKFLSEKDGIRYFKLLPPTGVEFYQRYHIYKQIIKDNLTTFLPDFTLQDADDGLVLSREMSISESKKLKILKKAYK